MSFGKRLKKGHRQKNDLIYSQTKKDWETKTKKSGNSPTKMIKV